MMMAVLLCFGIVPSNAFAAEYDYDGYISMIDYNGRGYSLSSSLPAPFGGYSTDKFTELRINDLTAFRTAIASSLAWQPIPGLAMTSRMIMPPLPRNRKQ